LGNARALVDRCTLRLRCNGHYSASEKRTGSPPIG
jgi:hypothetical protein